MSVGEDKPTKWVQREGQIMLSLKPNFGPYKNRWTKIHLLGFEKKFEQRKCSNDKFGVSFLNLRWRFCKRKEWDFSHKGWGGGWGTRTPLDPLDTDSPILACSRLSDRVEGAKRYEQKKKLARPLLFHLPLFFSFFGCTAA